jgi:hypothetical protein
MEFQMADDKVHIPDVEGINDSEEGLSADKGLIEMLKKHPVATVQALVAACEKSMQSRASDWDRYRRKYRRGLRYGTDGAGKNPVYSTNYIYSVIETLKANLTENLPALTLEPTEDGDDVGANVFTKILRKEVKRAGYKDKSEVVLQHGAVTGLGWFKVWFDNKLDKGKGALAIEGIAPEDVLVLSTMIDYRLGSVFVHRVRDVSESEIKAKYGVKSVSGKVASAIESDRSLEGDRKISL